MDPTNTADFDTQLASWIAGAQKIVDDHWIRAKLTYALSPVLKFRKGGRFVIVTRCDRNLQGVVNETGSAHAFIDMNGGMIEKVPHKIGDVLKPSSWKKPAIHARGNIFDAKNGLGSMGEYGPAYLR